MIKNKLIIIRGNPASGKSTIAEKLRDEFPKKTSVIHTTTFYWEIVRGDDIHVALENVKRILDNYLKNNYNVILEGTLGFKDKKGKLYVDAFLKIAKKYKTPSLSIFLKTDLKESEKREHKRKKTTIEKLRKIHKLTEKSLRKNELIIDTTNKPMSKVINEIKLNLASERA